MSPADLQLTLDHAAALAWTPFLEPINAVQPIWVALLVPLAIGIAATFKALRVGDENFWAHYTRATMVLSLKIILGVLVLGAAAHLFVRLLLPVIAPMPGGA